MSWASDVIDEAAGYFEESLSGSLDSLLSGSTIGTYYWVDSFRDFLYSYSDVVANEGNWKLNPGYSFKVVNKNAANIIPAFGEFRLPINPSNLQQNEEFAISFRPTQNGMLVEHSGAIFKELTISGTTGLLSLEGKGRYDEYISSQGGLRTQAERVGTIFTGGGNDFLGSALSGFGRTHNGYTWAHLLRNYIRAYAQAKTLPECKSLCLVFSNKKDGEEWQVEPVSIDVDRNASSPHLYHYRLHLRAIKRNVPEISDSVFGDVLNAITVAENIITNSVTIIDSAYGVLSNSAGLLYQVESAVTNTLLKPVSDTLVALNDLRRGVMMFPSVQRQWLNDTKIQIRSIRDNFYVFIDAKKAAGEPITYEETQVMKALLDLERGYNLILSTNTLFSSDILDPEIGSVFNDNVSPNTYTIEQSKNRTASKAKIEAAFGGRLSIQSPNSVESVIINRGESLEDVAYRTTGNVGKWVEIALLNNMAYPYIDETIALTNAKVKKAGDTILVPSSRTAPIILTGSRGRENQTTKDMTTVEKFMGVDLMINQDYDLVFSNKEDFVLSAGAANAKQALNLKIAHERGSLKYHPSLGIGLVIGTKVLEVTNQLADDLRTSILSDDRFEAVNDLTIARTGGTFELNLLVKICNVNIPVPMILKI